MECVHTYPRLQSQPFRCISFSLQRYEGATGGETEAQHFSDLPKVMQLEMVKQRFEPQ